MTKFKSKKILLDCVDYVYDILNDQISREQQYIDELAGASQDLESYEYERLLEHEEHQAAYKSIQKLLEKTYL